MSDGAIRGQRCIFSHFDSVAPDRIGPLHLYRRSRPVVLTSLPASRRVSACSRDSVSRRLVHKRARLCCVRSRGACIFSALVSCVAPRYCTYGAARVSERLKVYVTLLVLRLSTDYVMCKLMWPHGDLLQLRANDILVINSLFGLFPVQS